MKWYFIDSGANTGAYNMEFDMAITGACKTDEAVVRFYRWQPYCISLGKYQDEGSINKVLAEHDGIDTVLRPTGGRAVLHSEELTYSVVMHTDFENTPQFIYREINCALKEGLVLYHPAFGESALEHKQPDFRNTYKQSSGLACFAATAKNELKLDHRKLIGSAQRKIGNKILQHGSIICGSFHLKIAEYLNLPEEEVKQINRELQDKTIDIKSITGANVDYGLLVNCMKKGFESHFKMVFSEEAPALLKIPSHD